jgi:RNA recognition motif-containing protein
MGNRLYIGNLPFSATADELRGAFQAHGVVTDVRVVTDRDTGRSRGFAFVTMGSPEEAARAVEKMNGALLAGRPLRVDEAQERAPRPVGAAPRGFGVGGLGAGFDPGFSDGFAKDRGRRGRARGERREDRRSRW